MSKVFAFNIAEYQEPMKVEGYCTSPPRCSNVPSVLKPQEGMPQ